MTFREAKMKELQSFFDNEFPLHYTSPAHKACERIDPECGHDVGNGTFHK